MFCPKSELPLACVADAHAHAADAAVDAVRADEHAGVVGDGVDVVDGDEA